MNRFLKSKIIEQYGTQADFALALQIDETFVSRIIRGRRKLDSQEKKRWAKALHANAHRLFSQQDINK